MRLKNKISLMLAMFLLISVAPVIASDNINAFEGDSVQGTILNTETVVVDGVPVTFTLYDNNGVLSETVNLGENVNLNEKSIVDREKFINSVLAIADQRAESMYQMLSQNDLSLQDNIPPKSNRSYYSWTESKNNSAVGTGSGENRNTYAGHWSTVDYSVYQNAASMRAYNGASRVVYGGSKTVSAMALTEKISRRTWQISVSYPPGFSIGPSREYATLSSHWPGNHSICTQYRNNFSASSVVNLATFVDVNTQVQVYINNNSYTAAVKSTW